MSEFLVTECDDRIATITLNRPEVLNAWHSPMRQELIAAFREFDRREELGAIILTGAGTRAFCAGQDLNEAKNFDEDRVEVWIGEWEALYDAIRSLSKPLIVALNGLAAGSAFQVALLADFRVGYPGVRMGQPEINVGIASVTGPWIMREHLGLARTVDLALTGRMMDANECLDLGLINRLVPEREVMPTARILARELAEKPPGAMRLNKARLREITEDAFRQTMKAAIRIHRQAYASREPERMMSRFLAERTTPTGER